MIEMIVNYNPSDMTPAVPVVIVVMYPDEIPGSAKAVYIPVVSAITVSGKYFIILMAVFSSVIAYISLIPFAVRAAEGTGCNSTFTATIATPAFNRTALGSATFAISNF